MAARIKLFFVVPALLALLVSACSPVPTSQLPTTQNVKSPQPAVTVQPTDSLQPVDGPQPAWVGEFSEPILLALQDRPPDFQDDFSQPSDWVSATCAEDQEPCGTIEITNGVMTLSLEAGQSHVDTRLSGYENFILQVDLYLQQFDQDKKAHIVLGKGGHFYLAPSMDWQLSYHQLAEPILFSSGVAPVDLPDPVSITIIHNETESAIYLNGNPLTYNKDIERPSTAPIHLGLTAPAPNNKDISIAYDNFSVWNLDTFFNPPTETPQPTASPTPAPWISEFGAPILESIQGRPPDYQDDFSLGSSGWNPSPGGAVNIANGILALSGGAGQGVDFVKVPRTNFTNFVVQVELNTGKLVAGCEATIQWRGGADGPGRIFGLQKNKWGFYSIYQTQENFTYAEGVPSYGELPLSASGVHTITLISKDPEIGVYLDGLPLSHVVDVLRPADPGFHFGLWYPEFCVAEYDNLKVWDLDK